MKIIQIIAICFAVTFSLSAQTIAEKKAGAYSGTGDLTPEMQRMLVEVNRDIRQNQDEIRRLYAKVEEYFIERRPAEDYQELLFQINDLRENIRLVEESWREMAARSGIQAEGYALWYQPDTDVEQIVMDFGASDYVYLIPPEIADIKLSISSNIPVPAASWADMLETVLLQSGIGIRELNPFLRELFLLREDFSNIRLITSDREELLAIPPTQRASFVFAPEPSDVGRVWFFLDKFVNQNSMVMQNLGRVIMVIGQVQEIQEVLKIYDFILANKQDLQYRIVPLLRVDSEEMAKIVNSIFEQFEQQEGSMENSETKLPGPRGRDQNFQPPPVSKPKRQTSNQKQTVALTVIPLAKVAQAVFLVGTREEIEKAAEIILTVEAQVGEATDKTLYTYTVQHSDPEELASVLSKVYVMMQQEGFSDEFSKKELQEPKEQPRIEVNLPPKEEPVFRPRTDVFREGFYQQGQFVIDTAFDAPGTRVPKREVNVGRDNFIVDLKSSTIVMVIEAYLLPQIKELIKKLDVPKMMVQIDVLLFERKLLRNTNYGLNLFKMGAGASQTRNTTFSWIDNAITNPGISGLADGITSFIMSRKRGELWNLPAFDIIYKFLMSQEDLTLNASPSVVTVNQTQALIEVKEEISLSTGTFEIPQTGTGAALKDSFVRAQYGITILVTPTIHMHNPEDLSSDPTDYVTLVSDVTFQTFSRGAGADSQQPPVNTRHIVNEVRIPDGQSVIMGGLRRKTTNDGNQKIPFIGEIPGFGKLFSGTELSSEDGELIIFLKPQIIKNPKEDFKKIRTAQLCKRPGDIPEFLCRLNQALEYEKHKAFEGTMTILFGRRPDRCMPTDGHYGL